MYRHVCTCTTIAWSKTCQGIRPQDVEALNSAAKVDSTLWGVQGAQVHAKELFLRMLSLFRQSNILPLSRRWGGVVLLQSPLLASAGLCSYHRFRSFAYNLVPCFCLGRREAARIEQAGLSWLSEQPRAWCRSRSGRGSSVDVCR